MYTTRTTLLEKIAAGDAIGWREFFDIYRRLVFAIARKSGIPDPDADDILQKTMLSVFHEGKFLYRRETHGKFRTWFGGIVRHKIGDYYRERRRSREIPVADIPERIAPEDFEALFLEEYRRHLLDLAAEALKSRVSPEVFETFSLCRSGRSDVEVARLLGVKSNTVTIRRRRCAEILNGILRTLNEADPELKLPPL